MGYKRKFKINLPKPVQYVLYAVGAIVAFVLGKKILDKVSNSFSIAAANKKQSSLVDETLNSGGGVRLTLVRGVVDTITTEANKPFYQDTDEKLMVAEMNRLQTAEEVIYAANWFSEKNSGKSLRAFLKEELNSEWRAGDNIMGKIINPNAAGGSFSNLNDVVKTNLL